VEDRLHALVIRGELDLKTAQHEIATDWIAAYKKYVGPTQTSSRRLSYNAEAPRESGSPRNQDDMNSSSASSMDKVWVNTRSGKYFRPGQEWYGRTRNGLYMTETEAIQRGYRAAKGG